MMIEMPLVKEREANEPFLILVDWWYMVTGSLDLSAEHDMRKLDSSKLLSPYTSELCPLRHFIRLDSSDLQRRGKIDNDKIMTQNSPLDNITQQLIDK